MHFETLGVVSRIASHEGGGALLPPIIDKKHFSLFTDCCELEEKTLISTFFASALQSLEELRSSVVDPKISTNWRLAAHRLKGTAAQIGAQRLSECCEAAEASFQATTQDKRRLLLGVEIELAEIMLLFNSKQHANLF